MTKLFYLSVTTDDRPGGIVERKAWPRVFDFQDRNLASDVRSWWPGDGPPRLSVESRDSLVSLQEAAVVFNEIIDKKEAWAPLDWQEDSSEFLNHAAVIRLEENGDEFFERLWVAKEADSYAIEEDGFFIIPNAPRFKEVSYEDFFCTVCLMNREAFEAIREWPRKIVRFPDPSFSVSRLADDFQELYEPDHGDEQERASFPLYLRIILENHIGMGFRITDGGNHWFVRLQKDHRNTPKEVLRYPTEEESLAFEKETKEERERRLRLSGEAATQRLIAEEYFFEVAYLPG